MYGTATPQYLDARKIKNIERVEILVGTVAECGIAQADTIDEQEGLIARQAPNERRAAAMVGFLYKYTR